MGKMSDLLRQLVTCQCGYALLRSVMGTVTCWYVYQNMRGLANAPFISVCPGCGVRLSEATVASAEEEEQRSAEEDERMWNEIFARPHVQAGLAKLEEEAMRQYAAGEYEEGGFGVEESL